MDWVPAGRVLVVKLATLEEFKVPEPSKEPLPKKFTVPVGVPVAVETVAVKVTLAPNAMLAFEVITDVVVVAPGPAAVTVCWIAVDCDPAKLVLPL
jgi:hypothetical protein